MKRKPNIKRLLMLFVVIIGIGIVAGYFINENLVPNQDLESIIKNETILNGVYINNVAVGGMKYDQAKAALVDAEKTLQESLKWQVSVDDEKIDLKLKDFNGIVDTKGALDQAILSGRTGNNKQRRDEKALIEKDGKYIDINVGYNETDLRKYTDAISDKAYTEAVDASLKGSSSGDVVYVDEKNGKQLDKEQTFATVKTYIDAKDTNVIKLTTTKTSPKVTTAYLKENMVRLSKTSTKYQLSTSERVFNIGKASDLINGRMIGVGETFSINKILGDRTKESGWQIATGISDGAYIDDVGGGICQVSSTLYNSIIKAGLTIDDRRHHTFPVNYLDTGKDAVISTGGPDFVFTNNLTMPVYIVASSSTKSRVLTISVYGPKSADGTTISFETKEIKNVPPENKPVIILDDTLKSGEYKETKPVKNLIEVERWLDYTKDGKIVKTTKLKTDVYAAFDGEFKVGPNTKLDSKTGIPIGKKIQ